MRQLESSLEDSIFPVPAKLIGEEVGRQGTVVMASGEVVRHCVSVLCSSLILSAAGTERSAVPAESKDPYPVSEPQPRM